MQTFSSDEDSRDLVNYGDKEMKEEEGDDEPMVKKEATEFRCSVSGVNWLSQDSPDLQFP